MEDHSAHVAEYQEWLDANDWDTSCKAMLDAEGQWEDNGCRPLTDSDYLWEIEDFVGSIDWR